jgi:hypothetical protein
MTKQFQTAWDYRNNGMARGRIESAWNNMNPVQQQQAIVWAKSKGYDWTEMKLTPKPLVSPTQPQPGQVQAPPQPGQVQAPQLTQAEILPKPDTIVGSSPQPKPNVVYASTASPQKQPQTPLKTGAASEVPFIASSNPDNFYLLYSQVQYNVVI